MLLRVRTSCGNPAQANTPGRWCLWKASPNSAWPCPWDSRTKLPRGGTGGQLLPRGLSLGSPPSVLAFKKRMGLKVIPSEDASGMVFQPPQTQAPRLFIMHLHTHSLICVQKEVLPLVGSLAWESRLPGFGSQICPWLCDLKELLYFSQPRCLPL